jgi:hypothetical protein
MRPFFYHLVFSKALGYRLARHALFWLSYLGVFWIMDEADRGYRVIGVALSYLPFNMAFVYFVLYRLVPRQLMRSAYWSFFWWYCGLGLMCLTIEYFWGWLVIYRDQRLHDHTLAPNLLQTIIRIFDPANFTVMNIMAVLGVAILLYKFWRSEVWQKLQIRQEKTKAELELLRAQLHPRFLLNTLNNLYALVVKQSDKAPLMLMRLSEILSYVLYECRVTEVPLEREIGICKNYIELEREFHGRQLDVSVDISGAFAGKMIAPMLCQPFIEHAFLRAEAADGGKAWMSIEMSVHLEQFFFRVVNSVDTDTDPGIGQLKPNEVAVDNAIQRLELLYPERHAISREKGDGVYIVSLTIEPLLI